MATTIPLAQKYRPRSFDDVVVQDEVVDRLRQLVLRGARRGVIITGAHGSGKTTLARIFAKAVTCLTPASSGDPCGICAHCRQVDRLEYARFFEVDCTLRRGIEFYRGFAGRIESWAWETGRRALFFDEAQGLRKSEWDLLLKPIEDLSNAKDTDKYNAVVIFATVDPAAIPSTVLSSCVPLTVKTLSAGEAAELLVRVCRMEGIQFDPEALELIALRSGGHGRDMLRDLERVAMVGRVTVDQVRNLLSLGNGDTAFEYFDAVIEGDRPRQMTLLRKWLPHQPSEKREFIKAFSSYIYQNEVVRVTEGAWMDFETICREDRQALVEKFGGRANALGMPLKALWHEVMDFWLRSPVPVTEVDLLIIAAQFDYFLNMAPLIPQASIKHADESRDASATTSGRSGKREKPRWRAFRQKRPGSAASGASGADAVYLSAQLVQTLWEAASLLIQEFGVCLNTRVVFRWEKMGITNQSDGARVLGGLVNDLAKYLERGRGKLHWISVHEHTDETGFESQLAMHVAEPFLEEATNYLQQRLEAKLGRPIAGTLKIDSVVLTKKLSRKIARIRKHWDCVRWLCRCLDPELVVQGPTKPAEVERPEAGRRLLVDLLRIPASIRRPAGMLGPGRDRYDRSATIRRALDEAARVKMRPLSAFRDGEWACLASGWELQEHPDWVAEQRRRREEEREIRAL